MAKDPAILFYTSDFLTGTLLMSNEQKGKYITLLCLQHQKWELSEKDMLNICSSYDKDIFDKFVCSNGFYYNERMRIEHEKRSNFSKSRSENRLKGLKNKELEASKEEIKDNNTSLSYDHHMENENEDINTNTNNNKLSIVNKKVKEEKIEVYEKVKLTETQISDSKQLFLDKWQEAIEILSNYKQSSGKTYKSDYHALIGWVKNKIIKENGKQIGTKAGQQHPLQSFSDLANGVLQGLTDKDSQ